VKGDFMSDSGPCIDEFQKVDLLIADLRRTAKAHNKMQDRKSCEQYCSALRKTIRAINSIETRPGIPDWYYLEKGWEIPQ